MEVKYCKRCDQTLPVDAFHKASKEKSGLQQWCKLCRKNHDVVGRKQYHRTRYHTNKDGYLDWMYKRKYGINLAIYNTMLEQQNGTCAVCSGLCVTGRRLAVDHCHETGEVRGLLCSACNKALGLFKDNVELMNKAIDYLRKYGTL